MTNVQQGMSKEEVLCTNVLSLLPWTFLVRYWAFFFRRALCGKFLIVLSLRSKLTGVLLCRIIV